jgi:hypothetical protein
MRAARDEGVAAFKAGDYYAAATLFERALAAGEPEAWALQRLVGPSLGLLCRSHWADCRLGWQNAATCLRPDD